jgi:hypothetical protein
VLLTDRWRSQLVIGWGMGTVVTMVALYLSYALDLPSGPTVVSFYGLVLVIVALLAYLLRAEVRRRATARLALGLAGTTVVVAALWLLGTVLGSSSLARDHARQQTARMHQHHHQPHDDHHRHHELGAERGEIDPMARMQRLKQRVRSGAGGWRRELVEAVLDPELPLLFKEEALQLLRQKAGQTFGFDPDSEDNTEAARKMRAWAGRS